MLEDKNQFREILNTVTALFKAENKLEVVDLIQASEINSEQTYYDSWNNGTTYYSIYIVTNVSLFVKLQSQQTNLEKIIGEKFELVLRPYDHISIAQVLIIPKSTAKLDWARINDIYTKEQMIIAINILKNTMISVSTGGQKIQDINDEYKITFSKVTLALKRLSIENPNPYSDLWQWYGRWSNGEMLKYQDRRIFIAEMYSDLIKLLQETEDASTLDISVNLDGWERIGRSVSEIKVRLVQAKSEEQCQAIGLLCRETIISLAQAVFDAEKHPTLDGIQASKTDAKRMLDAYIGTELAGGTNESIRKYARASNDLANELTHKRTALIKDALLCSSATISLVNLLGILEDRQI